MTKGTRGLGSWETGGDHPNDSIIENGQNSENSPGDLRLEDSCCHLDSNEKPSANADVKISNEWIMMMIREERDMSTEGKPKERNLISCNSSTKQCYKDEWY